MLAPSIQCFGLAERVVPSHGGRIGLGFASQNGVASCIRFQRIQGATGVNCQRFACAIRVDHDLAGLAVAAGDPRVSQQNRACAAIHSGDVVLIHLHTGRHLRDDATGEFQCSGGPLVGMLGGVQLAGAFDFDGFVNIFANSHTSDEARKRDGIAAHVQNATAAQLVVQHAAALFVIGVEAKRGLDQAHLTDCAAFDDVYHFGDLWMTAIHEGFHQEDFIDLGSFDDGHDLGGVHAHRLLTHNVLARLSGLNGPLGVPRVGRGDVNRLHIGVGQQRLVAGVAGGDAELVGELIRFLL